MKDVSGKLFSHGDAFSVRDVHSADLDCHVAIQDFHRSGAVTLRGREYQKSARTLQRSRIGQHLVNIWIVIHIKVAFVLGINDGGDSVPGSNGDIRPYPDRIQRQIRWGLRNHHETCFPAHFLKGCRYKLLKQLIHVQQETAKSDRSRPFRNRLLLEKKPAEIVEEAVVLVKSMIVAVLESRTI